MAQTIANNEKIEGAIPRSWLPFNQDIVDEARRLIASNPGLRFRRARRRRGARISRIDRNGIAYYVRESHVLLNPYSTEGVGLAFVTGDEKDPTGVFFTEEASPSDDDYEEAKRAYLFALGVPRCDLNVVSATLRRDGYERTPENLRALREAGAWLPHEEA